MDTLVKKAGKMMVADHQEGRVASAIEEQTSKLPSDLFLWTALGCLGAAAALKIIGRNHTALLIGQWASPFLLFGIYDKMVKLHGHDQHSTVG